ncbi:PH (Pleckstrin Homology) domain-containing protein [Motilibacter peucedani]|uniref:PH (Pleckstrin Homology) domain-containing protein n=1 Tax=Motilibacter peucedani TaxID=598650 RepID=A0A420XM91_9ACTN|nr:PH domain-containing protein [Motilibacter peucedani]RKS71523.1 PH (Pleckstrin Homology) domain-containing protein [Motilibacter peucedani]
MQDASGREVVRSEVSRAFAVIWWVLTGLLLLDVVVRGSWPSGAVAALVLLLTMVGAFAFWWRPEVVADDDAVTLRNPLRDIVVPWARVVAVGGRWTLDIRTERATYTAFAAAPKSRPKRSRRGDEVPTVPTSGITERLSDRWERRRLAGADGPVVVRWRWEVLAPALALVVALVLVAVAT